MRWWKAYVCATCGGLVVAASSHGHSSPVTELYPVAKRVAESVPNPAGAYLTQALDSLSAPAGAVMLTASAVDAMLKVKGYKKGTLYERIDAAVADHVITSEMGAWAHEVRLDANDPRHADEEAPLPSEERAKKCLNVALALSELLFVLPARVERGRAAAGEPGG